MLGSYIFQASFFHKITSLKNMENRRQFLKKMAVGVIALNSAPSSLLSATGSKLAMNMKKSVPPNSYINIALIGKGGMGTSDTQTALSVDGVKLLAVCDLYDKRLDDAKRQWGNDLFITKDYKEVLALRDVDAVIIATPDHWHQTIAIEAMKEGKHIYCEKPVIHQINEAKALIEAQEKNRVFFQIGSQGMASVGNQIAKLLIQNKVIGKVNFIDGQFTSAPGILKAFNAPKDASEKTIWWERFLGNAPKRPFDAQRFFAWRNWKDYGTTIAGDLFVHVISSVHYIMDTNGPNKIYTTGGIHHYTNGSRDTPDVMLGLFDYPEKNNLGAFTLSLGANYVDGISKKWGSTDFKIIGSKGSIDVKWNEVKLKTTYDLNEKDFEVLNEISDKINKPQIITSKEYNITVLEGDRGAHFHHFSNFFDAIRNNKPLEANVHFGVRSSATALLSYESYKQNQAIYWNPESLKVRNKPF